VVAAVLTRPKHEHDAILRNPRRTVLAPKDDIVLAPAQEQGLSVLAKHLLRRLLALERNCLETAHIFCGTELAQLAAHEENRVRSGCVRTLVSLGQTQQTLREAAGEIHPLS